jgi:cytochrome b
MPVAPATAARVRVWDAVVRLAHWTTATGCTA